jgi:hypothetical protein
MGWRMLTRDITTPRNRLISGIRLFLERWMGRFFRRVASDLAPKRIRREVNLVASSAWRESQRDSATKPSECGVARAVESQRDSAIKPRVARNELPWVCYNCVISTLKGL